MMKKVVLKEYLIKLFKMFHGLSTLQVRQLAYKFAIQKSKVLPSNWIKNEAAGEDWVKGFRNRHKHISLRQPEAISIARATAFNKHNMLNYSFTA